MRIKPIHAVFLVLLVGAGVLLADYALDRGFGATEYERVSPGRDETVRIDLSSFEPMEVRFYRFLNPGNQEVKFFVGRDASGEVQVGFDANEICYKRNRGYRYGDGWLTCNVCDKAFRLENTDDDPGGCAPVALAHRVEGDELVLTESQILKGWRYFR